jgi:S-ribosylhomocysteine lyase
MGCRTGFYAIFAQDMESKDALPLVRELFEWIVSFSGAIPGAAPAECGNWSDQNLDMAKWEARRYLEVLTSAGPENLSYPD